MRPVALAAAAMLAAPAVHAAVHADSATAVDVSFFGSGILTGAPDGGGAWLSDTSNPPSASGWITFGFSGKLVDGPGTDIQLFDVAPSAAETFDVAVSADGTNFILIGGFSATNSLIDIGGLFAGTFSFVRVTNTSATNAPDLDAALGFHEAPTPVVPAPAALPLLLAAVAGFAAFRRRDRRRSRSGRKGPPGQNVSR